VEGTPRDRQTQGGHRQARGGQRQTQGGRRQGDRGGDEARGVAGPFKDIEWLKSIKRA